MEHHGTGYEAAAELEMLADLQSLPGVGSIRPFAGGFSIEFPEVDFVVRMPRSDAQCETDWEVTVREPLPGLNTWWGRWHRSFSVHRSEAGPLIAAEVNDALLRVRGMLEDHAQALQDA